MPDYETQASSWHSPSLTAVERKVATYLELEIVNARRRTDRDFDVEIDYLNPGGEGTTGWMPLVLIHEEWRRRPGEVGDLVEAAGGRAASACAHDRDCVRDLDDEEKFMGLCHGIWALACARAKR